MDERHKIQDLWEVFNHKFKLIARLQVREQKAQKIHSYHRGSGEITKTAKWYAKFEMEIAGI